MSGSNARSNAIRAITSYKPDLAPLNYADTKPTEIYGSNVFSDKVMKERLPRIVYKSLRKTIEQGVQLDPSLADIVASTMKDWAIEKGATHFTHVFYPLTGHSAEKHDGFLSPDGNGGVITEFSGKMLSQGEADGSSFPSGGLRSTFEARGYTAWDVTSPAYLMENSSGIVLCIPTAFLSWTGVALDRKTPLLRSNQALNKQASRILKLFGKKTSLPIISYSGLEQEFFLIDRNFVFGRPDLLTAGRTLFGAKPAKGQEFEDQYYGVMPRRVMSCITETERELYKLGVPVRTHHNEVAPSQYEIAPVFETANLAIDHNQLMMTVLKKVAKKHGLHCLLHEKPFSGINGSGKHLNYSIGNAEVGTLFEPGETPHENAMFLVFLVAAIRGLHKYGGLLRATVAAASNDHRLGANEAPPAIMSMFLGDQLTDILEQFRAGKVRGSKGKRLMNVGVDTLPPLPADPGARTRTSPFAFTGNRFEFRALGSSMPASASQTALNTIMADSLDYAATRLEKLSGGDPEKLHAAVGKLIQEIVEEHSAVIFNGDGYSEIWHQEAERRGLPNYRTTPEALMVYTSPDVVDLYGRYNVLSRQELKARQEIYIEQYCKTIRAEANLVIRMGRTIIYPAGLRFQQELLRACLDMRALNREPDTVLLDDIDDTLRKLREGLEHLEANVDMKIEDPVQEAHHKCTVVIPAMNAIRALADHLETIVPEDLWPLPSYQEMLFVK
ncbi:glutamine synthetase III [uncultured Bilophila sp.]|uniref:glutamine synthetase III family protein n=1 Tax=uncultured Bilophila sp. TaxID=529385 RepID=UPI00280AFD70|nr:glutamine synthetase III [uncultured Bilophila sp.]